MKTIYYRPEGYVKEEIQPGALDTFKGALSGGVKKEYEDVYKKELRFRVWHLFAIILPVFIITLTIINLNNQPSFDDYLTNYDFEKARIEASKLHCREEGNSWNGEFSCPRTEAFLKIINAESLFLTENLEFDRAISVVREITSLEKYNELFEKGVIGKTQDQIIDELVSSIILLAINHPDRVDDTKIKSYLGLIKNEEEVVRLKKVIGIK
jgi:hypothetical protein